MAETLTRTTFSTSRLLEFFTEKELIMQIGHQPHRWPIALLKEMIDNALDACETAEILPVVNVEVTNNSFTVSDNGPGLSEETLKRSLDYLVRVSDKSYYVSPTRGQLGNALKCVYAAPFVVDGEHGRVQVETGSKLYTIDVSLDRIEQAPAMELSTQNGRVSLDGTKLTVFWPDSASLIEGAKTINFYNRHPDTAKELIASFAMFNPHATFTINGDTFDATNTDWKKWRPSNPTSAHWYDVERLRALIAAYISAERNGEQIKTVREFVKEFRGLAGTAKQKRVTEDAGLHEKNLLDLVQNGDVAIPPVERLLSAMQEHSKQVKPNLLGVIGKEHFIERMTKDYSVDPESIRYKKLSRFDEDTNFPHVLEVGFGIYTEDNENKERIVIAGLNWAPTLDIPIREFQSMLQTMRIDRHDPVCVVLHIARPQFEFTDRGKGMVDV